MKKQLLLAATVLLGSLPAHAAIVSYSASHSATTNWDTILSLPKFDAALGVLQEVRMQLSGGATTLFAFENLNKKSREVTQSSTVTLVFDAPGASEMVIPFTVGTLLAGSDGSRDYAGPAGYARSRSGSVEQNLAWLASTHDLSDFIGPGALGLKVEAKAVSISTGGARDSSISTTADASVRVSYLYGPAPAAAVPEPGSLALVLAALAAGLAVPALRRRQA